MSKVRIEIAELKQAIAEIEARSNDLRISFDVEDRRVRITSADRSDNMIEIILHEDGVSSAQFRSTERLMFMKGKKTL